VDYKENFKLALTTQSLEKRSFDKASEKNKQKRLRALWTENAFLSERFRKGQKKSNSVKSYPNAINPFF